MNLTSEQLHQIAPAVGHAVGAYVGPLNAAMSRYGIDTPQRAAHFLAQIAHESGDFTRFREDLNYSAVNLLRTWPKRFTNQVEAQAYANQPEKIANFVYANRMGNGDQKSGDGWRYRGAGWIQLTGKNNQRAAALELGVIDADIGNWLATVPGAALSAAWFWWKNGCSRWADTNNVDAVSDIINIGRRTEKEGDAIGYTKRLELTQRALKVLS
ncbi:putative chitinase [Pseudoduganella lurida]|uniref:Putative chitinase n=1 Tax=Pseudoduganella lurida TaxID=1036180 RepID=A0A562RJ24_9BURK|nr:glycoside hydrolase family 19 protein [Pseudoduganella lurida]TWI69068.1 putative chitinase [Pseudoduganella lurida]